MLNIFRRSYLTKNSLARLEKFQYTGSDISILYTYVLSPFLENYFMKIIPLSMAPNLISLLSFIFNFFTLLIFILETNLSFEVKLSSWALLMKSFSHMTYLILDNVDGKQARRTKTSSPLGLLLDHGLDAITTAIVAYNCSFMAMLGNNNISSYFLFLGLYIGYYIANYEEYRTGKMILGPINGPDEGNFFVFLVALFSFILGVDTWHMEIYGLRLADLLVFGVGLACVQCSYESLSKIFHQKNIFEEFKVFFVDNFWLANALLLPLFTYLADRKFYFDNLIFFLTLMTIIFLRISIELLINIVCKRKIRPNSLINFILVLWYLNIFAKLMNLADYAFGLEMALKIFASLLGFELLKFVILITIEIRDHLGLSLIFMPPSFYENEKE